MAQAALDTIKKIELEASNIILSAEEKAQDMIESASEKALIDKKNNEDKCKALIAREKAVATKKAFVQTKQYKDQTAKICDKLEKELLCKKKRAVFELTKFVIEHG